MSDYILDTHVLLWSIFNRGKLSQTVQSVLMDRNARKHIAISSMWEIVIKNRIGKLPLPNGLSAIYGIVETRGYGVVGVERQHLEAYASLPLIHRDPFDGIIIAIAITEGMTLITADENMQKYNVPWVW